MNTITPKSIPICIILSIVTCGIYSIYWLYCMARDINNMVNDPNTTSAGLVVILSFITCGIYFLYWTYKTGTQLDAINIAAGRAPESRAVIYLLLSIFGLSIVTYCLIQDSINKYAPTQFHDMNDFNNTKTF